MTLVTLDDAKRHLGITDPAQDGEVQMLVEHASALMFEYAGARAELDWDETTTPDVWQAATLKTVAHLYEHRGDDAGADDEKFWAGISLLCMRARDPGLA